jgi:hypothetical protein
MEIHSKKILGFAFLLAGFLLWCVGLWLLLSGTNRYQMAVSDSSKNGANGRDCLALPAIAKPICLILLENQAQSP